MVRLRTFILCEKTAAAAKIANALGNSDVRRVAREGVVFYKLNRDGNEIKVFPAQGHLFALYDTLKDRTIYPVFDLEWAPVSLRSKKKVSKILDVMREEAKSADIFVNACDYDIEGETIGYNILRYICGREPQEILRMKFSSLTATELLKAFHEINKMKESFALAGRARHYVDFIWGINLSRVLTEAYSEHRGGYRTFSIGRVQGATLHFVYQRECEIRSFVPTPYWTVSGVFIIGDREFAARYTTQKIYNQKEAFKIKVDCDGKEGKVVDVQKKQIILEPPAPFNLGDLQRAAYRYFGYSPARTLNLAESLYLKALISYPRTNSQKLPKLNYYEIVRKISKQTHYSFASNLLTGTLFPREGAKDDPAHPAIYPTGERPKNSLPAAEFRLYDLIVRRFLSSFAPPCKQTRTHVVIDVVGHKFHLSGVTTDEEGWLEYYGEYSTLKDIQIPELDLGLEIKLKEILCEENFESPPARYNQASLLNKMENEEVGTKATRSEIIATLFHRGYVKGSKIELTNLGFAVVEAMLANAPEILGTELTRMIDKELEMIETDVSKYPYVITKSVENIARILPKFKEKEDVLGGILYEGARSIIRNTVILGGCPICKTGSLIVLRSAKTKKRFVGCDNYSNGCKASAPLPQRGFLTYLGMCKYCRWPLVESKLGKSSWRFCININCPSRSANRDAVQGL